VSPLPRVCDAPDFASPDNRRNRSGVRRPEYRVRSTDWWASSLIGPAILKHLLIAFPPATPDDVRMSDLNSISHRQLAYAHIGMPAGALNTGAKGVRICVSRLSLTLPTLVSGTSVCRL